MCCPYTHATTFIILFYRLVLYIKITNLKRVDTLPNSQWKMEKLNVANAESATFLPYFAGLHDLANTETTDLCALRLSKRSHVNTSEGRAPILPDDLKEESVSTPSTPVEIGRRALASPSLQCYSAPAWVAAE
jgi:hypothetical protein